MSKKYICDVSGIETTHDDKGEQTLAEQAVQYQGKTFNISLIVHVEVAGLGWENTNIHPNEWPAIMQWVKNKISQVYG